MERREGILPFGDFAPSLLEMTGAVLTPLNVASEEGLRAEIELQQEQGADFIKVGLLSPTLFKTAMRYARERHIAILGHLQDGVDAVTAAALGFKSIEHLGPGSALWTGCSRLENELMEQANPVRIKAPPAYIPFLRRLIQWHLQTVLINPAAFMPPGHAATLQRAFDSFSVAKCRQIAARFAAEGTWHVPTLVRLRSQELADLAEYERDPYLGFMPANKIRRWRAVTRRFKKLPMAMRRTYSEAYDRQLELTRLLSDEGVRLLAGTDGGWLSAPGLTLQQEFIELGRAGLSPLKILQMTTINAAEYLQRTGTMGTIEPGRDADLVLLEANPLDSVAHFSRIAGVVRAGRYLPRTQLDGLRESVAAGRGFLR
jgi:hypothetical protein